MSGELEVLKSCLSNIDPNLQFINLATIYPRRLSIEGAQIIRNTCKWPNVNSINLAFMKMTDKGIQQLSKCNWQQLKKVNLESNQLSLQGAKYISQNNWKHLQYLGLSKNKIGKEGAKYISQANWPLLQIIDLNDCLIGTQGASYLCNANWINLKQIYLSHNNIGNDGLGYIISCDWKDLQLINLGYNKIDGAGAYWFCQAKWPKLKQLYFAKNYLGIYRGRMSNIGPYYLTQLKCKLERIQIQINQLTAVDIGTIINSDFVVEQACARLNYNCEKQFEIYIKKNVNYN